MLADFEDCDIIYEKNNVESGMNEIQTCVVKSFDEIVWMET